MGKMYALTKMFVVLLCMSTLTTRGQTPLSGNYTINSGVATGGTNYQSFTDFANDINANGVSGSVTVEVTAATGPYIEQVLFNQIDGASGTNNIVINGNNNLITFNSTNFSARHTIGFNGTDHFTINELQVQGTGTVAWALLLYNAANFNTFSACSFSVNALNTSSNQNPVVLSGSSTGFNYGISGNNNTWVDCDVFSGYYGMVFYGPTSVGQYMSGNKIINCHVRDFYLGGIYMLYQNDMVISGNLIEKPTRTNHTTCYGLYATQTSGSIIEKNTVQKLYEMNQTQTGTTYAFYTFGNSNSTYNGAPNSIRNNIVQDIRSHTTLYCYYVGYISGEFAHNTVSIDHPTASAFGACRGIWYTNTGTKFINSQNNMVYIDRGGSGIKAGIYYSTTSLVSSDYNNIWMGPSGTNNMIGWSGGNQITLANLQTASGNEANSFDIDPLFVNASNDVMPTEVTLNDQGTPLGVVFDHSGAVRNQTTPDIGALEFLTPLCSGTPGQNAVTSPTYAVCPGESVSMGLQNLISDAGLTYQWQESNTSVVGPFTTISGQTGLFLTAPSVTANTWYNVVMTCTAPGGGSASYVGAVQVAGPTSSTVPYVEDFEGIGINGRFPNCSWSASDKGGSNVTYVTPGTGNRVPNSGAGFATFNNNSPGTSYYYTNPIQMEPGITYSAAVHYATEYFGHSNWTELSILVGPNQNSTGMVQVASVSPAVSGPYKLLHNTFTVSTSGQYYVAIRATSTAGSAQYLSWDDLSITIPCDEGSPNTPVVSSNASSNIVCEGDVISINATGASTYSWSTGDTGPSISASLSAQGGINQITVWGTDMLTGCTASVTEVFTVNPSPNVWIAASNPVTCSGDATSLTGYGALSYAWSTNGTGQVITVNPTSNATYTVIGVNEFGCSSSFVYSITVNPLPSLIILTSHPMEACKDDVLTLTANGAATYIWTSNASSQVYQGTSINVSSPATAVFTVTGTDANGCMGEATIVQNIAECTSIAKSSLLNALNVFPNPTTGEINIEFANTTEKTMVLTDVTGRVILIENASALAYKFDISTLANGIYYLKLSNNQASETIKIVKN